MNVLKGLISQFRNVPSFYRETFQTMAASQSSYLPMCRLLAGGQNYISIRTVSFGKKGKLKTVKAVAKRFKRTGKGALKYWRPGKTHKMLAKSSRARRELRKPRYANKTQLKLLNKMLSGI